ncbi:peptidase [Geitlerinema sp. PCC 7407]|uniref:peptidase n=1 Tax=Geitlerinema sp. PCC 7407 TaxID=1173025 RepID=UPI00029F9BA9|nr:peptidase [Geitlerinema sp. PCC 7407]AFY65071.1 peptidase metallopeptidase [Geitlerinema sp. PCC 7407]
MAAFVWPKIARARQWRPRGAALLGFVVLVLSLVGGGGDRAWSQSPAALHPLPPGLVQWQPTPAGDYFEAIEPTDAGYLQWSQFPIWVYVEPPPAEGNAFALQKARQWETAVLAAIAEWQPFLPMERVDDRAIADIEILRSPPPLRRRPDGTLDRIRSAETRYELVKKRDRQGVLALLPRCTLRFNPHQTPAYLQAAARHELGHALGIWGHSPVATDALYFAQVREPAAISERDLNTLRRVYEQPTRLGWPLGQ